MLGSTRGSTTVNVRGRWGGLGVLQGLGLDGPHLVQGLGLHEEVRAMQVEVEVEVEVEIGIGMGADLMRQE